MATHVSIEPGRLYPQPGYTVQIDKEGKWTATQIFLCHRTSAVALMPRPGTPHPEIGFISVSQVTVNFTEGDLAEITCQYAGSEEKENEKANAVYTMGLSLSEEPLLSHLRYKDLPQGEREAIQLIQSGKDKDDQGNKLRDKVTSVRGIEALAKIDRGQTSCYSPRVTWRESWVRNRPVEAEELNKIGNYKVTIKEGWVIERQPMTGDHPAVKFHMPGYDGKALDSIPKPEISMSVDDILWCRYQTDATGALTGTPEIIVDSSDKDGVHYYPRDPAGSGGEGDCYVKLLKLELDGSSPRVRVYQQSDIEHWAQLWTGENVGYGVEIYKEHEESVNIYKFRRVDGRGSYISDMPDAYTTEQIRVVKDNETARVIGNGKTGSRTWRDCDNNDVFKIEWNDGLITSTGHLYMLFGCDGHSNNSSNNA